MILALMMFLIAAIMIGSVIERQRADIIIEKTVHNSIGSVSCDCSKNIEEIQKGLIEINSNLTKLELKSEFETEEIVVATCLAAPRRSGSKSRASMLEEMSTARTISVPSVVDSRHESCVTGRARTTMSAPMASILMPNMRCRR